MDSTKRKRQADYPSEIYSNKSRTRAPVEARLDPIYGQRSALPYLDDETTPGFEDQDLNYDDGLNAIEYLKSVRQEASSIPNLLVAPDSNNNSGNNIYENDVGNFRGWYEDGAYVGSDVRGQNRASTDEEDDAYNGQAEYYHSILSRYDTLRTQLQRTPPPELVDALDNAHPSHLATLNVKTAKWWIWNMKNTPPLPVQVASMDKSSVLRLLGLITQGTVLKGGLRVEVGLSLWVWSLLARLPDRGSLTSEEIGVVRELGKKAVMVGVSLKQRVEWEAGIQELEDGMEGGAEENEVLINADEIDLAGQEEEGEVLDNSDELGLEGQDDEEGIDDQGVITNGNTSGPHTDQPSADTTTQEGPLDTSKQFTTPKTTITTEPQTQKPSDADLEAIKTRLLDRLAPDENLITPEPTATATTTERQPSQPQLPTPTPHNQNQLSLTPNTIFTTTIPPTLDVHKARLFNRLAPTPVDPTPLTISEEVVSPEVAAKWNTQATVDMILTVAGEAYGQRDLLEFRGDWEV